MSNQSAIVKATACSTEDAAEIEEYMAHVIFVVTPDWQEWVTSSQFNIAARQAYQAILYMRSPEGKAHFEKLEKQYS